MDKNQNNLYIMIKNMYSCVVCKIQCVDKHYSFMVREVQRREWQIGMGGVY